MYVQRPLSYLFLLSFLFKCAKSECQQLICEILRATPEAASADAAVQTARFASKAAPSKDKRQVISLLPSNHIIYLKL